MAFLIASVFGLSWLLTATVGVSDVARLADRNPEGWTRIDFDPDLPHPGRDLVSPWYLVGRTTSPFPFIVFIDCAYRIAPLAGDRSEYYVLWLFGLKIPIMTNPIWMS